MGVKLSCVVVNLVLVVDSTLSAVHVAKRICLLDHLAWSVLLFLLKIIHVTSVTCIESIVLEQLIFLCFLCVVWNHAWANWALIWKHGRWSIAWLHILIWSKLVAVSVQLNQILCRCGYLALWIRLKDFVIKSLILPLVITKCIKCARHLLLIHVIKVSLILTPSLSSL